MFNSLVGSDELRDAPIHRWFSYKEGFSPRLLSTVLDGLEIDDSTRVLDVFAGVGTTALSAMSDRRVVESRSVEYSPLASWVARTKCAWPLMDPGALSESISVALDFDQRKAVAIPELSSLTREDIFSRAQVKSILNARRHIAALDLSPTHRDFLLLGLAALIEDLSGAYKDGRALRIRNGRSHRPRSLAGEGLSERAGSRLKKSLGYQWTAMVNDLAAASDERAEAAETRTHVFSGDARNLDTVRFPGSRNRAIPDNWADLSLFSPPYLNFIDYSEVYKLELWLMGHIQSSDEFKRLRLGTLRSHPSVKFPPRAEAGQFADEVSTLVTQLTSWMECNGPRPAEAVAIQNYFDDMRSVWIQQSKVVSAGGTAVCIVANSTASRREKVVGGTVERWRVPILTDVILAHLALSAGFRDVRIVRARSLRPRNVSSGEARESLIVATR